MSVCIEVVIVARYVEKVSNELEGSLQGSVQAGGTWYSSTGCGALESWSKHFLHRDRCLG